MSWVEEFFDDPLYDLDYEVLLADEVRAEKEAEFIVSELSLGPESRVLDLACGHGRHAVLVAGRVGRVVGFDRTERFLEHARKRAEEMALRNVEFVRGDMRALPFEGEFDAAYNYFTAWGYFSDEENHEVLVGARRSLRPGGWFLLEFLHRDALMKRFRRNFWDELSDGTFVLHAHEFDCATGRIVSNRTYLRPDGTRKTIRVDHVLPTGADLMRYFREAGFEEVRLVAAPDGGEVTIETRRIAVVGRAS